MANNVTMEEGGKVQMGFTRVTHNRDHLGSIVALQKLSVSIKFGEFDQRLKRNYVVICIMSIADDGR